MVVENAVSGREDIAALFWENKLGIDVDVCIQRFFTSYLAISIILYCMQDKYRIILFEEPGCLKGNTPS